MESSNLVLIRLDIKEVVYMENKKKKKYLMPEAEIVDFANEDILTTSGRAQWWEDDSEDNVENWPF